MKKNYLIYSFAMHISILIIAIIASYATLPIKKPSYQKVTIRSITSGTNKNNTQSIPKNATREQKKDTPKKVEQKLESPKQETPKKQAPPKQVKKDTPKQPPKNTAKTVEKQSGLDSTSKDSTNANLLANALASITDEVQTVQQKNGAISKAISRLEAETSAPMGTMDYATYVDIVGTILKNQWIYPNFGRSDKLRTIIRVFVDGTGLITNYKIERTSGRDDFDASAVRAIEQYTHFPIPPNRKPVDFVINFNLLED